MPPLALLALAFAGGIALADALALVPATGIAASLVAALGLAVAWRRRRWLGVAAVVQASTLGALALAASWPVAPAGLLDGAPWTVTARVVEAPERGPAGAHALLELERVARDGGERTVSGRISLSFGGDPLETLLPGDRVRFRARLHAPHGFAEPDSPDPRRRSAARALIAVAGVAEPAAVARLAEPRSPSGNGLLREIARGRERLLSRIRARLDGDRRALVESLVLGDRGDVDRSLDQAFRVAGVSHVLSVSGLHLAIAAFLLFVGLRWLLAWLEPLARRVAVRRIAALFALPATAIYTLLTGAAVATVRSCVVAWIWLGAIVAGRSPDAVAALGGAALAILAWSPLSLWDPSFQLSFAAALGMALAPKWRAALGLPSPTGKSFAMRILRWAVSLIYASAAAIVATAPIAAWHFGQIAPVGLVANLAVVPLAELWVLPIGLAACAVSSISPWLGNPLFDLAGLGAAGMARLVRWIASWAPEGRVPSPTVVEALLWYAALVTLALPIRRARRIAAGFLLLFAAALATRAIAPRVSPSLTVTFLDVGQGDSCLVELPGATLLVDGGGSFDPRFDPGEELIAPWLARHGVRRLDAVVLTHPHPDHANGLAAIVERFPVGEVWTNGAVSSLPGLVRLEKAASDRHVPVVRPHPITVGDGAIEVLHPLPLDPRWSENDGSIVLRVRYRDRAVLLAGDIEARAEEKLVAEGAPLSADVLKAPHHGSPTSSTPDFVAAVHPGIVVFSVGEDNRWHFPGQAVQERWRGVGAQLFRTDRDGAITVKIDRSGEVSVEKARRR